MESFDLLDVRQNPTPIEVRFAAEVPALLAGKTEADRARTRHAQEHSISPVNLHAIGRRRRSRSSEVTADRDRSPYFGLDGSVRRARGLDAGPATDQRMRV